jgi:hypothetical protein
VKKQEQTEALPEEPKGKRTKQNTNMHQSNLPSWTEKYAAATGTITTTAGAQKQDQKP